MKISENDFKVWESGHWQSKEITFKELAQKLSVPLRTKESYGEFLDWLESNPSEVEKAKAAAGGYIGGELNGSTRNKQAVIKRDLLTIDLDKLEGGKDLKRVLSLIRSLNCNYILHSSRKYTPKNPRIRIVIPLSRSVSAEEYERIAKNFTKHFWNNSKGEPIYNECFIQPERFMFYPTISKDADLTNARQFFFKAETNLGELGVESYLTEEPKEEIQQSNIKLDNSQFLEILNKNSEAYKERFFELGLLERDRKDGFGGNLLDFLTYPKDTNYNLKEKISFVRKQLKNKYGTDILVPVKDIPERKVERKPKERKLEKSSTKKTVSAIKDKKSTLSNFISECQNNLCFNEPINSYLEKNNLGKNPIFTEEPIKEEEQASLYVTDFLGLINEGDLLPGNNLSANKDYLVFPTSRSGMILLDLQTGAETVADNTLIEGAITAPAGLNLSYDYIKDVPATPIFITDNLLDMLALLEAGANAVIEKRDYSLPEIMELLDKLDFGDNPIVLAYNVSNSGEELTDLRFLKEKKPEVESIGVTGEEFYLDANSPIEALNKDYSRFRNKVKDISEQFERSFLEEYVSNQKADFLALREKRRLAPSIKTGFDRYIDSNLMLDGGLFGGNLYAIGAETGSGKSTLTIQMAANIAESGIDVIYYSLEMPWNTILARNISRISYCLDPDNALSEIEVLDAKREKYFSDSKLENLSRSTNYFFDRIGNHLKVKEGLRKVSAIEIGEAIKRHFTYRPNQPLVVFIDYLQLLAQPSDTKYSKTDKQIMDENVLILKQLARDYDIPIFYISSLNRDSYNKPITLSSFKESGSIEYTSSAVFGLESFYKIFPGDSDSVKQKKYNGMKALEDSGTQRLRIKLLKNRQGIFGTEGCLEYIPKYNFFTEIEMPPDFGKTKSETDYYRQKEEEFYRQQKEEKLFGDS